MLLRFVQRAPSWLGWLLVAALLRLAAWGLGARILPPTSDESLSLLMAQWLWKGEFPLLFWTQPYLFPLESYLQAIPALAPPSAWVTRGPALLSGLLVTALSLQLLPATLSRGRRGLACLLVVFPSTYVIVLQGFYAPPGYAVLLAATIGLPWLALRTRTSPRPILWFGLGLSATLAFAAHSLSLCASLPALLVTVLRNPRQTGWRPYAALALGLLAGALPYLLARETIAGAHALTTESRPLSTLLPRLWEPTLTDVFPGALGLRPVPFVDTHALPGPLTHLGYPLAALGLGTLVFFGCWRGGRLIDNLRRGRPPSPQAEDVLFAVVVLNLMLFVLAPRADSTSFRYLAPGALALPVLLAHALLRGPRLVRNLAAALGLLLLLAQLASATQMVRAWREPGFAARMGVPDLRPALEQLDQLGIRHVVASYGAAYRITYLSGGRILAAQPFNERFPAWPIPFKDEVDAAPRVAYVLTDAIRFLKPAVFERHLRTMDVSASVITAGAFRVYHSFQPVGRTESARLPPDTVTAAASTGHSAGALSDGHLDTAWRTGRAQAMGDWLALTWSHPAPLSAITVYYRYHQDTARSARLWLRRGGDWSVWPEAINGSLDKFELRNGHPVYGRATRRIALNGEIADGVRLEITEPTAGRDWSVSEVEIETTTTVASTPGADSVTP
jgi:hypothetical protein